MRLVVRTRLPEQRLRAALRRAAARALAGAAARRQEGGIGDFAHQPATSMLGRLAASRRPAGGFGLAEIAMGKD